MSRNYKVAMLAMCLMGSTACSDIPEICKDDMGRARACDAGIPDMNAEMDLVDVQPDLMTPVDAGKDSGMGQPDLEQDMCTPRTQMEVCNGVCGMQSDGCQGMIDCGEPLTEQEVCANACGEQSDGCGGTISCAPCACVNGEPSEPTCGACNLGISTCDGDTFSCDIYDIPNLDAQTDCDSALIYVNATFDGEMSDGSRANPFKTIADANAVAKDRGAVAIFVGGNQNVFYEEVLEVQDGVSVFGGWSIHWLPDQNRIPLIAPTYSENDSTPMQAVNVADTLTEVANLRFQTPEVEGEIQENARNSYGAIIDNSEKLRLRNLVFTVASGSVGPDGQTGERGLAGMPGEDGLPGYYSTDFTELYNFNANGPSYCLNCSWDAPPFAVPPPANFFVSGGDQICKDVTERDQGGASGAGGFQRADPTLYATGEDGVDSITGVRGGSITGNCNGSNGDAEIGTAGSGDGGKQSLDSFLLLSIDNALVHGHDGDFGRAGKGGGGGAGAPQISVSGYTVRTCSSCMGTTEATCGTCNEYGGRGASGGGGGSGGCGGEGGQGGRVGGSSVGFYIIRTSSLFMNSVEIFTGHGGAGGAGGEGGSGGIGGTRGLGTREVCTTLTGGPFGGVLQFSDCRDDGLLSRSCSGGSGGKGQTGGYGGGGAGGNSIGIYCDEASTVNQTDVSITLGNPGMGGTSPGKDGQPGLTAQVVGCE